jgi:peptide/nickel transport system permease protein
VLVFLFVIWATASLNFLVPRLAPGDPMAATLARLSMSGDRMEGGGEIIEQYRERFGLDESLVVQYFKYLGAVARLDFGYSLASFPSRVMEIISRALPWTVGLLLTTTVISFGLGMLLGAFVAWRSGDTAVEILAAPFVVLAAIPYYLLALLLVYALAFGLHLFPSGGTTRIGATMDWSLTSILDVLHHSILPALSIILSSLGGRMISMRSMMVRVMESDFLTLARAKGLSDRRIFLWYAARNAILPEITTLGISLGFVVSGATLVEVVFSYPGIGYQLYRAIGNSDFNLIQGITLIMVISVALAILVLDLIYPKLDPRITYAER